MKKITTVIGSLLLFSMLLVGCGSDKQDATPKNDGSAPNAAGEDVYNQRCASCHGQDLKGMGQDLTTVKDRLSKEEITEINKNGKGAMPGGQVNDEENEAVTTWLLEK